MTILTILNDNFDIPIDNSNDPQPFKAKMEGTMKKNVIFRDDEE